MLHFTMLFDINLILLTNGNRSKVFRGYGEITGEMVEEWCVLRDYTPVSYLCKRKKMKKRTKREKKIFIF